MLLHKDVWSIVLHYVPFFEAIKMGRINKELYAWIWQHFQPLHVDFAEYYKTSNKIQSEVVWICEKLVQKNCKIFAQVKRLELGLCISCSLQTVDRFFAHVPHVFCSQVLVKIANSFVYNTHKYAEYAAHVKHTTRYGISRYIPGLRIFFQVIAV